MRGVFGGFIVVCGCGGGFGVVGGGLVAEFELSAGECDVAGGGGGCWYPA